MMNHQELGTGHLDFIMGTHSTITLGGYDNDDAKHDDDRNEILPLGQENWV